MSDVTDDIHPAKHGAVGLLRKIAQANSRDQVSSIGGEVLAYMWRLETGGGTSLLDIDNLGIVFKMASEKRLHELAFLKS